MQKSFQLIHVTVDNGEPKRQYWDFVVSGESLQKYLRAGGVTQLGYFPNKSQERTFLRQLRMQEKSELVDRRVEIYVCSECGDIGCGAVTVRIEDHGDRIIWKDFAHQSDPEYVGELIDVEPLEFDRESYFKALAHFK
jgi:hypothetical protein